MIDIDHFKWVNDTYGHPTGDDVIRTVAERFGQQIRKTDVLGRYGGEEFAVLLQDAQHDSPLPERLRACIADEPVQTRSGPGPGHRQRRHDLPDRAGRDPGVPARPGRPGALRAKQGGRNQVHFHGPGQGDQGSPPNPAQ